MFYTWGNFSKNRLKEKATPTGAAFLNRPLFIFIISIQKKRYKYRAVIAKIPGIQIRPGS